MERSASILRRNIQKLIKKAVIDKEFRDLVLEDSRKAYNILIGQELPKNLNLKFIDKDENVDDKSDYYVLPSYLEATWLG